MRCRFAIFIVALPGGLSACATADAPALLQLESRAVSPAAIAHALRSARIASDQALRIDRLTENEHFSAHLLQIRTRRARHIHANHDVTLMVHRGHGLVTVERLKHIVGPGDVFHIPRGTPHGCSNTGSARLVFIAVFTPPLHHADTIDLPAGSRSHPRAASE